MEGHTKEKKKMVKVGKSITYGGGIEVTVRGDTKAEVEAYFAEYCKRYHPAGYGTCLKQLFPFKSEVAGVVTTGYEGHIYRYTCCD